MTRKDADALAADLERAGMYVHAVEAREPRAYFQDRDEWQVVCWRPNPALCHIIIDAARFRWAVRNGLVPELPPNALD